MSEEYSIHGVTFDVDEDAEEERSVDRITAMEEALDAVLAANETMAKAVADYANAQDKAAQLANYLGSEAWFSDLQLDAMGRIPHDLKRGVLSEDGAFNALADNYDTAIEMLEAATKALKNN